MTVSARSATDPPAAATAQPAHMRAGAPVRAGSFAQDAGDLVASWHTHDLHQVQYAFEGTVEVETTAAHYLLPPQQAVWIPAGLAHRTTLRRVRTVSVFLDPAMVDPAVAHRVSGRARVLPASPLIREMIVHSARWPIGRPASDPLADAFFAALAGLTIEWLDREVPLCLPTGTDPVVTAAMDYTNAHLGDVTLRRVCRAVGVSERTLRRRFAATTDVTWRQYLLHSRLLRSVALLAEPGPSVLDVATAVGFDSPSAFTRAFTRHTGQTPTAYRRTIGATGGAG
jgi:AraC-like DNA-binding protein